jgi:hypothetical protein
MMRPFLSFLFTALVLGLFQPSLAMPAALSSAYAQKLKDAVVPPPNWIDLGPAPPMQPIWLRIALPQARFSELERQLYEMSDPKNARYGQHLMKEQVTELVRPDWRSVEAVDAWLAKYGITGGDRVRRSVAGDWVTILVPVAIAEEMLDAVSSWLTSPKSPFHTNVTLLMAVCCVYHRNSIFGGIPATAMTATCSSARRTTAFQSTCTRTSNLYSLQRTSVAPTR